MRISSAAIVLLLSACGSKTAAPAGIAIGCALDGATAFTAACTAERVGDAVVVHRPDGGFRRIVRTAAGAATDGAEPVTQAADGTLTIGADRYRLPK